MDADSVSQIATLLQGHSWLALALLVIPMLDKAVAEGQWPFSLVVEVRYRLALIAFGGVVVLVLQRVQAGSSWPDAIVSAIAVTFFAIMKNGGTLFPSADTKDDNKPGTGGSA